jgi:hypothetical protein
MLGLAAKIAGFILGLWNFFHDKSEQEIGAAKQENKDLEATAKTEDAELQAAVDRPTDAALDHELLNGDY